MILQSNPLGLWTVVALSIRLMNLNRPFSSCSRIEWGFAGPQDVNSCLPGLAIEELMMDRRRLAKPMPTKSRRAWRHATANHIVKSCSSEFFSSLGHRGSPTDAGRVQAAPAPSGCSSRRHTWRHCGQFSLQGEPNLAVEPILLLLSPVLNLGISLLPQPRMPTRLDCSLRIWS